MSGKRYIKATFCSLICIYPGLLGAFASDFLSLWQTQTAPLFAPTMRCTLVQKGWAVPGQGVPDDGWVRWGCTERQLAHAVPLGI